MPNRRDDDPIGNFNFKVEIEGVVQDAMFEEVAGIYSETEVIEYRGGGQFHTRKVPGSHVVGDITLKRGYTNSKNLWDWREAVVSGQIERKSGSIILLATDFSEIKRWNFFEAWPSKWEGPFLSASANGVAIETLVLVCERIEDG